MTVLPNNSVVLETLGDHRNMRINAWCPECGHYDWLDLEAIAQRVGWEAMLSDVVRRLRCSSCGHRPARVTLHPGGGEYYYPP